MIPDKNFRMKKSVKTMLALMSNGKENKESIKEYKAGWKHMFIDAQLSEDAARKAALKSKDHDKSPGGRTRGAVAPD